LATITVGRLLATAIPLILIGTGVQGLRRGEFQRRRSWGDIGGPREFPPIRGGAAIAFGVWLIAAGVGILAYLWRR
jgi:hypothetical protein